MRRVLTNCENNGLAPWKILVTGDSGPLGCS